MKTAIVTIAAGHKIAPIAKLSIPLMMQYAERIGSDFIRLSPTYSSRFLGIPNYEKLQIFNLLKSYDRVAFIDADTLVSPRAHSLFEVVANDQLGVFFASRYGDGHNPSIEAILDALGEIPWAREDRDPSIYESFNSGVLVVPRDIGSVFLHELPLAEKWAPFDSHEHFMNDQPFLNYVAQKHNIPMYDIGYKFNHTLAPGNSEFRFRSHIIHYAGVSHREASLLRPPTKAAKMKHDHFVLSSRFLFSLAASRPSLVHLFDRFL